MERNQNYVELWGVAAGEPVFSHENHTRRFDKFPLRVGRFAGLTRHRRSFNTADLSRGRLGACGRVFKESSRFFCKT